MYLNISIFKQIVILFTLALLLTIDASYGQNTTRIRKPLPEKQSGVFRFGFLAGPLASQIDGDGHTGFKKIGFNTGIKGEAYINKNFIFEVNLAYSLAGSKIPPESPENRITDGPRIIRMNFAEVPFILNYRLPHKKYPLHLELGVGVQQLLKYDVTEDGFSAKVKSFDSLKDQMNNRNYMALAGIERFYEKWTLALRTNISLNYQYYNEQYFTDLKNRNSIKNQIPLLRNYYISFVAGYTLFASKN